MDEEFVKQMRQEIANDWTIDPETHRSNSSPEFLALIDEVARLIRWMHVGDDSRDTARLIMAQLAHVHHLAPRDWKPKQEEA